MHSYLHFKKLLIDTKYKLMPKENVIYHYGYSISDEKINHMASIMHMINLIHDMENRTYIAARRELLRNVDFLSYSKNDLTVEFTSLFKSGFGDVSAFNADLINDINIDLGTDDGYVKYINHLREFSNNGAITMNSILHDLVVTVNYKRVYLRDCNYSDVLNDVTKFVTNTYNRSNSGAIDIDYIQISLS